MFNCHVKAWIKYQAWLKEWKDTDTPKARNMYYIILRNTWTSSWRR